MTRPPDRPVSLAAPLPAALRPQPQVTLVDLLDTLLDKGVVVAGDIRIGVGGVELVSVKLGLVICSLDRAEEAGLDWWNPGSRFALDKPPPALPAPRGVVPLRRRRPLKRRQDAG